ncbi:MAG: hypothetical protein K5872_04195 [Rhizobiaceae bacterium]|nr:hypothetical protein [Rhizobiaceae bacterium]MCV0405411.1 hypothetical protein [Rhizobiaceae bacterium]
MADRKRDEIEETNRRISRPPEKSKRARHGKVFAGQRAELAANPVGDKGSATSETRKAVKKASRGRG